MMRAADGTMLLVVRVSIEQGLGLYHPHLASLEDYAVDGVLVSQFTEAWHPTYGPMYGMAGLKVLRMLHGMGVQVDTDVVRAGAKMLAGALVAVSGIFLSAPVVSVPSLVAANSTA